MTFRQPGKRSNTHSTRHAYTHKHVALFGCGWGLSGFCPGPAVVSFAGLMPGSLVILPSIFAGMLLKDYVFGV